MCGIAGGIGALGLDATPLQRMVASMRLRGPDDSGTHVVTVGDRACWLGNTRLSILDLSPAGHMPMQDEESGNWITYNGEVYNFNDLREPLVAQGEPLRSRGDTEVSLKLYRREGPGFLTRLRGMFAFAIWDAARQELFLVRDRLGKKPLYYTQERGRFLFASEIRTLLASGLVSPRLDPDAVRQYLANGFMVSPTTILKNVQSLLPGHWMRVGLDGEIREIGCYWTAQAQPDEKGWDEASMEEDRRVFQEAVRLRLVSDVPVGVFLSGGMDSSAIVGALSGAHDEIRTFSLSFPSSDLDESRWSRQVASHWKTTHTELPIGEKEFYGWLPEAMAAMDQPTYDGINSFFVAKAAHDAGLKVVMSGLGADEVFGGYPSFKAVRLMSFLGNTAVRFPPLFAMAGLGAGWVRHLGPHRTQSHWRLADLLGQRWSKEGKERFAIAFYQLTQTLFPSWSRQALLSGNGDAAHDGGFTDRYGLPERFVEFLQEQLAERGDADAFSLIAWRLFLGERCLRDVDSMSMGVSLEVRAPFTDYKFVERMMRVPGARRCGGAPDKPFEQVLLAPFLEGAWQPRAKRGFVMPFTTWFSSAQGSARIGEVLEDGKRIASIGLSPDAVRSLWRAHRANPSRVPWGSVWAVFVLATWCDRHGVSL